MVSIYLYFLYSKYGSVLLLFQLWQADIFSKSSELWINGALNGHLYDSDYFASSLSKTTLVDFTLNHWKCTINEHKNKTEK